MKTPATSCTSARCAHGARGFTLIELIATMAVVGALGSIAASIMIAAVGSLMQVTTAAQLHTEASIALDRVDRELRNIPIDDTASDIAPDIKAVTPTMIAWEDSSELLLDGTQLKLTLGGANAVTLLQDVTAFSVKAFDEDNTALAASLSGAACDPIRRLLIEITVSRDGVTEHLRTRIFLRCAMTREG